MAMSEDWRALQESAGVGTLLATPSGSPTPTRRRTLGTLVAPRPAGGTFTYRFLPDDVLWLARFIVGEAGGRDTPENRAVIWAMFNRYGLLTHRYYSTFHRFIRAYSTPLQPVLRSWRAARRHMHKPSFVRTGDFYPPPAPQGIPRGQLRRFLDLQSTPWARLPSAARSVAQRAVSSEIENPIGNATEFGSTFVYFRDHQGRNPNVDEWRRYTEEYARRKNWIWIGPVPGLDQRGNAFFVQMRLRSLPRGAVRILRERDAATPLGGGP